MKKIMRNKLKARKFSLHIEKEWLLCRFANNIENEYNSMVSYFEFTLQSSKTVHKLVSYFLTQVIFNTYQKKRKEKLNSKPKD